MSKGLISDSRHNAPGSYSERTCIESAVKSDKDGLESLVTLPQNKSLQHQFPKGYTFTSTTTASSTGQSLMWRCQIVTPEQINI